MTIYIGIKRILKENNIHKAPNMMPTLGIPYNGSCDSDTKWSLYSVLILYLFTVLLNAYMIKSPLT